MDNNYNIFKYLKPNENDNLSSLSGTDLQYLIVLLNEYYLELRDNLNLDKKITFGTEIECEDVKKEQLNKFKKILNDKKWHIIVDYSLFRGKEIISPILSDNINYWKDLDMVCRILKECSIIKNNAAGHIHVGTQILDNDFNKWVNFLKLWGVYENIIFRFGYGEYLSSRVALNKYSAPLKNKISTIYDIKDKDEIEIFIKNFISNSNRFLAVNFNNVKDLSNFGYKNTIEFRCPNGTLEATIWQNNINFFTKLLLYANSNNFDNDRVEERKSKLDEYDDIMTYSNEIFLEESLELADMIFDNNLDKLYFLRQYLKSFEIGCKTLVKAKTFISSK